MLQRVLAQGNPIRQHLHNRYNNTFSLHPSLLDGRRKKSRNQVLLGLVDYLLLSINLQLKGKKESGID
jgi:hypothetical protein